MINREDMLELTRRMTPARTSFTRIAGCYVDADGDFDGSFNINFLKLSPSEKTKNLAIAKTIPFAETNTQLKKYEIQTGKSESRKYVAAFDGAQRLRTQKRCPDGYPL